MPPKRKAKKENEAGSISPKYKKFVEVEDDEYRKKRERNNLAVKKSREKTKAKAALTEDRVTQLKMENQELETKVTILSKELSLLKDLFLTHASAVKMEEEELCVRDGDTSLEGRDVNREALKRDHEYSVPLGVDPGLIKHEIS